MLLTSLFVIMAFLVVITFSFRWQLMYFFIKNTVKHQYSFILTREQKSVGNVEEKVFLCFKTLMTGAGIKLLDPTEITEEDAGFLWLDISTKIDSSSTSEGAALYIRLRLGPKGGGLQPACINHNQEHRVPYHQNEIMAAALEEAAIFLNDIAKLEKNGRLPV
ncbi:MAG: hypothetical protein WC310_02070 [Patescibacteria group bacterium]|jgi:hypothetical protein